MSFTADDALHLLQGERDKARETFFAETTKVTTASVEEIKQIFPDVNLSRSKNVVYFPMKMCHSLPKVNKRGRCFTPKTLSNSFATAQDNLIDIEHELVDNGIGGRDNICGHIKAAVFGDSLHCKEVADSLSIPETPIPVYALGALYLRHSFVPELVKSHMTGKEDWHVSMECGHSWRQASLLYDGEMIPFMDAPSGMLQCIKSHEIKPYRDRELAAVIGGPDGVVDFWGLGMTLDPADEDGDVLAMVAGQSAELASNKKHFLPIRGQNFGRSEKSLEVASAKVDTIFREIANLSIIGETEPADDGHVHQVLSDGTIVPANGHSHYLQNFNVSRGSSPSLTGRTDNRYDGYEERSSGQFREVVHMHLIDIPLKGKTAKRVSGSSEVDSETASLPFGLGENDVTVKDLLKRVASLEQKVSTGNKSEDEGIARELASFRSELEGLNQESDLKEAVEREIASKIESGELVEKDEHEKKVDEAVKAAEEKAEAEAAKEKKINERKQQIQSLGVNLDFVFDEDDDETVGEILDGIEADETGDKEFKRLFRSLKLMADTEKEKLEQQEAREAANTGKGESSRKRQPLLVGGGDVEEEARELASQTDKNSKKIGKNRFSV